MQGRKAHSHLDLAFSRFRSAIPFRTLSHNRGTIAATGAGAFMMVQERTKPQKQVSRVEAERRVQSKTCNRVLQCEKRTTTILSRHVRRREQQLAS